MTATSITEKEIVLRIFKDFTVDYNPSNIAKKVGKTRVGTFKALNFLEQDLIVKGKNMGKARFYWLNLDEEYARSNVATLLMEEAKAYNRWKSEFKELSGDVDIIILFGSIVKNEASAKDIDLLLVYKKENNDKVNRIIKEKNEILTRKIHPVKQTMDDIKANIKKRDKIIISAIKDGIVLHGYGRLVELIKDARS
jgi:predicted nucleotidyltransferase